ncbi:glycosyltransferase family 9 protein [candidate division KSB1 bacterium]|nr:glycosyltransferase family 9 protein [candidate division KSB1 bacterium]
MSVPKKNFKKIAVFSISGIGNTIFAVPLLRALHEHYPAAKIYLFVRFNAAKALLDNCPFLAAIEVIDAAIINTFYKKVKLIQRLRRERFDLAITAFPSEKREKNLFSFLVGAPVRVSHQYNPAPITELGFLQTHRAPVDFRVHDLEQNLQMLTMLDLDISQASRKLELWVPAAARQFAVEYLNANAGVTPGKSGILVGLHAGSSEEFGMILKRWGIQNFAALADRIIETYQAKILLFGGPEEKALKYGIAKLMRHEPIIVEKTSILKDAALMQHCQLFVSNDSGNMNLALALGVNTIGLFGPVESTRANVRQAHHKIIKSPAPCSPCWKLTNLTQPLVCTQPEVICMQQITVERVFEAVAEFLSAKSGAIN